MFNDTAYIEKERMICWVDSDHVVAVVAVDATQKGIYGEFACERYSIKWVIDESHDIEENYKNELMNARYMTGRAVRDLQYMLKEFPDQNWNNGDKIQSSDIEFILSIKSY